MKIIFENGKFKTEKKGFVQYDYGQTVTISGLDYDENYLVFQFIKGGQQIDALGEKDENGDFIVAVPDQFLQTAGDILIYCVYKTVEKGQTENCAVLDVLAREMYEPTEPQPYHDIIAEILEKLAEIQDEIDHWTITPEQLAEIVRQVEAEIDLDNYYTKQETNDLLDNKADKSEIPDVSGLATKQELTNGLSAKADKTDTYTKTEVDNLIPDVSGFATKTELGSLSDSVGQALSSFGQGLNNTNNRVSNLETDKADKSATYTKTEVDNLLNSKANTSDLPDMTNYYTKTETYSKTEIDNILGDIQTALEAI
jgi:hypothetical protein